MVKKSATIPSGRAGILSFSGDFKSKLQIDPKVLIAGIIVFSLIIMFLNYQF
ncbi:MAG: preprotein translocase subunit Sec61beta [Candidatus Nanoarchaeia archaeon]|nr:preprotein translocase subunit Sec61beta [Candidatus Nanoarchaeia archaeon]